MDLVYHSQCRKPIDMKKKCILYGKLTGGKENGIVQMRVRHNAVFKLDVADHQAGNAYDADDGSQNGNVVFEHCSSPKWFCLWQ